MQIYSLHVHGFLKTQHIRNQQVCDCTSHSHLMLSQTNDGTPGSLGTCVAYRETTAVRFKKLTDHVDKTIHGTAI